MIRSVQAEKAPATTNGYEGGLVCWIELTGSPVFLCRIPHSLGLFHGETQLEPDAVALQHPQREFLERLVNVLADVVSPLAIPAKRHMFPRLERKTAAVKPCVEAGESRGPVLLPSALALARSGLTRRCGGCPVPRGVGHFGLRAGEIHNACQRTYRAGLAGGNEGELVSGIEGRRPGWPTGLNNVTASASAGWRRIRTKS